MSDAKFQLTKDIRDAYREGCEAAERGDYWDTNPYSVHTIWRHQWFAGYAESLRTDEQIRADEDALNDALGHLSYGSDD